MKSSSSSSSSSSWDDRYVILKKQINDLLVDQRCKGEINKNKINEINKGIENLNKDNVSKIESETIKRKILIDNLKKNLCLLSPSSNTLNPLQISRPSNSSSNNDNTNKYSITTPDSILIERQKDIIRIQDQMLTDIDKGVGRIKDQAFTMNDEIKLQNKILTKLDNQVDDATVGLREEARHAEQIRQKSQMCVLYICVLIEIIVIAILLVVLYA